MTSTTRATRSMRRSKASTPNQLYQHQENIIPTLQPDVSQPLPEVQIDSLRKRHRMSPTQLMHLESLYQKDTHPSRHRKNQLAEELGVDLKTVTIWFQNKRQFAKRSQPSAPGCSPLQIRNAVSQTQDHQPVILPSVCSEKSRTTPFPQEQESDVNGLPKILPQALHEKDQARPTVASKTSTQELWQHLPSSPTAPSLDPDRGSEVLSATRDEQDARHSKRGLTLEWACDRQMKRRRAGRDNGHAADGSSRLWAPFGSSKLRSSSALSLLSLATGKVSTSLSTSSAPSQDVIHGASLLLSFKHSLRGRNTGKK
ncbi:uncharacterized protein EDB93DRAFT_1310751 [Suillus bovinus]|uniref:uncharacterized protein n=1 Tax=Suillus bovinus TaxID=48563 RepID=UPI001B874E40|nr:uncharacterized protein EDB93DRAFT_1310751 [Suillus bovinus]KAG2156629.1 hypothetical protein EDB93DRAFT_1310751 [Suillus bovinus]